MWCVGERDPEPTLSSWYFIFISLYWSRRSLRTEDSPRPPQRLSKISPLSPLAALGFLKGRSASAASYKASSLLVVVDGAVGRDDAGLLQNLARSGVSTSLTVRSSSGMTATGAGSGVLSGTAFLGGLPLFFLGSAVSFFLLFGAGFADVVFFASESLKPLGLVGATASRDFAASATSGLTSSFATGSSTLAAFLGGLPLFFPGGFLFSFAAS